MIGHMRALLRTPEVIARTCAVATASGVSISEADVRDALIRFDPLWDEFFPAAQARIVQLLVDRVDVSVEGVDIRLRKDGLAGLYREVAGIGRRAIKAA